jgi:hypothetical protein
MYHQCEDCKNLLGVAVGSVIAPGRKWWQFWKTIKCKSCDGSGRMKPPISGNRVTGVSPPPPRKVHWQ